MSPFNNLTRSLYRLYNVQDKSRDFQRSGGNPNASVVSRATNRAAIRVPVICPVCGDTEPVLSGKGKFDHCSDRTCVASVPIRDLWQNQKVTQENIDAKRHTTAA